MPDVRQRRRRGFRSGHRQRQRRRSRDLRAAAVFVDARGDQDLLGRFGVTHSFIDGTDITDIENALTPATRLIVLESPNSMTFEMQDLAAVAQLARARGIRTLCDNSYATPLNQSPIALGIDMVAHSATKYLNGHSDVVAGRCAAARRSCARCSAGRS